MLFGGILIFLLIPVGYAVYLTRIREVSFKELRKRYNRKTKMFFIPAFIVLWGICLVYMSTIPTQFNGGLPRLFFYSFIIVILIILLIQAGGIVFIRNKIYLYFHRQGKNTYQRELPQQYSPAMLSYIQNQKIEGNKDIIAEIISLCAKKAIDIEKVGDDILITDLDKEGTRFIDEYNIYTQTIENRRYINNQAETVLTQDEYYLYRKITKKDNNKYGMGIWLEIIKNSTSHFYKLTTSKLGITFVIVLLVMIIPFFKTTSAWPEPEETIISDIIVYIMLSVLILGIPVAAAENYLNKKGNKLYNYNRDGAEIVNKINSYKKFLNEYSLIESRELEEVYLWEEHLAYALALNVNHSYYRAKVEELGMFKDIDFNDIFQLQDILYTTAGKECRENG